MICPKCNYSKLEPYEYNPKGKHKLINCTEDSKLSFNGIFSYWGFYHVCPMCGFQFYITDVGVVIDFTGK